MPTYFPEHLWLVLLYIFDAINQRKLLNFVTFVQMQNSQSLIEIFKLVTKSHPQ